MGLLAFLLPFQNCSDTSFKSTPPSGNQHLSSVSDLQLSEGEAYGLLSQEAAPPICYSYAEDSASTKPPKGEAATNISCSALPKTKVISRLDANGNIVVRVIFPREFVDNTYGQNAVGWGTKGHTFNDLVGSDHVIVTLYDKSSTVIAVVKLDYISLDNTSATYKTLGVDGGEGKMLAGNRSDILGVRTSLDANINDFGYNLTVDSPATDANYTPNPSYPKWIYNVWYDVTIKASAFAAGGGYGKASVDGIHASPSKASQNTCPVVVATCE